MLLLLLFSVTHMYVLLCSLVLDNQSASLFPGKTDKGTYHSLYSGLPQFSPLKIHEFIWITAKLEQSSMIPNDIHLGRRNGFNRFIPVINMQWSGRPQEGYLALEWNDLEGCLRNSTKIAGAVKWNEVPSPFLYILIVLIFKGKNHNFYFDLDIFIVNITILSVAQFYRLLVVVSLIIY